MSSGKVIAVIGSTGLQGKSVTKSLLADGSFKVRAITRNANSDAARELRDLGADVVVADLEHIESLKNALRGAYGVWGNTGRYMLLNQLILRSHF
jgi:uncharacterized protein YbjT (DUF2867 family)